MKKTNKKGIELNQAFPAVLTLILIAMLVIIGIYMFVSLKGTFTNLSTNTVTNESVTMATGVGTVANATLCNFGNFAVSSVTNTSTSIGSGNYTIDASAGTITNTTSEYTGNTWIINHTSTWGGESCSGTDTVISQFGNYPALVGLVGTIIFLGLVIGILVISFAFGGRKI